MNLESEYFELKAEQKALEKGIKKAKRSLKSETSLLKRLEKARWIFVEVTKATQIQFKERVESLVTMALRSVYDRPLEFELQFLQKGNRFQCIPKVIEGDNEYEPEEQLGGGALDVISFAFRVVLWSLQSPRTRPTFVMDEPLRFLGEGVLLDRAGTMLREISHKLDFQIIIITHAPQLTSIADRAFVVTHDGTRSHLFQLPQTDKNI